MGFSIGASQCLVAPPVVFAGMLMLICGWLGDKYRIRGPIVIFNAILSIIGLILLAWGKLAGVKYLGVFLTAAGVQANIPTAMAYQANNILGQWTRAFASATLVCGGGLGGISGSLIFRSQDAPRYLNGIYGCIV
jgi:MFS family permease